MDHFQKLKRRITRFIFWCTFFLCALIAGLWYWGLHVVDINPVFVAAGTIIFVVTVGLFIAHTASAYALEPLSVIWRAILHVSPEHTDVTAPNLEQVKVGRQLVTSLALQVYQLASQQGPANDDDHRKAMIQSASIVSHMPLPLFVFNKDQLVTNVSDEALTYCQLESAELLGKPLFDNLNLEFPSERTLEKWIIDCQENKVTDTAYWERVRVRLKDQHQPRQCDMAAYYNRDNPAGAEYIVTLFDRTEQYNQDDESMSFVALAVHELRTPLTVLRGYIEVFEEELTAKLDESQKDFM
ncbi:MAG TPA: histidine kinase dimerization/phospho-acceptor domain-containing protein, partial [Candidatus Saccharimonadales bacterium]|nr:histidine kinase dimerization/phospho-acceptor domain-containing protein [Candidatus Saccharimonadales bacterium]